MATISEVKDVVQIIMGGLGLYVAFSGLNTWKRSLKGSIEYELTRRLLKSTYKLRDAIKAVRNPFMLSEESPTPSEAEAAKMIYDEIRHHNLAGAYQKRWDRVSNVRNELQTDLLEAEALWGSKIHKVFESLFGLQSELFVCVRNYIESCNPKTPQGTKDVLFKIRLEKRDVLYELGDAATEVDGFQLEIKLAIKEIEDYLKTHLKK